MTPILHNALDTISKEQAAHAMAIGFLPKQRRFNGGEHARAINLPEINGLDATCHITLQQLLITKS
jgi:hypothetical protein